MSRTRGYYGFKHNCIYYLIYNHYGSNFEVLGKKLLNEIKECKYDLWLDKFKKLKYITSEDYITSEECITNKKYESLNNYNYNHQSFKKILDSNLLVTDKITIDKNLLLNDDSVDYIYILDFDDNYFTIINKDYIKKYSLI
jgi:hypothetical protein